MSLLAGFLLLVGVFGASDNGRISVGSLIVWVLIGLFLTARGALRFRSTTEEYPY